jgi:hypothetical protein
MFALYWPVMALVAGLVIIVSALSISMSRLCRVRMDPLPERDLNSYLPEDELNQDEVFQDFAAQGQPGQDYSLDMSSASGQIY